MGAVSAHLPMGALRVASGNSAVPMSRKLPPDRLPKGTRLDLVVLLARCRELENARVSLPRHGLVAMERIVAYLRANDIEGGKS